MASRSRLLAAAALVGTLGACYAPDHPPDLPLPLPASVVDLLSPDSVRVARVAPGVWHRSLWSPRGPWAIHVLEVDLDRCQLGLEVAVARGDGSESGGYERVSGMVSRRGRSVVAAVNGDFFTPEGRPLGPEASAAGVRSTQTRPGLVYLAGARGPWIGTVHVRADSILEVGLPLVDGGRATQIVGGFPELLDEGRRVSEAAARERPSFALSRHPRTAVGLAPERGRLWLVVVDGRQGDYSTGMSLPELTDLLEALGASEALNLDGGGSSVMVVRGRIVNRPSDDTGERPVVNALMVVADGARCVPPGGGCRKDLSGPFPG